DPQQRRICRPAQIAEVSGRAVFVPEHGVRPSRDRRNISVPARTRRADSLAVVVDPEGHSDGVAVERAEFPDLARPWPPYHSFKTETVRPGTVVRRCWGALRVHGVILRDPGHFASIADLPDRAVVAPEQRQLSHNAVLPQGGQTREASTVATKVLTIGVRGKT